MKYRVLLIIFILTLSTFTWGKSNDKPKGPKNNTPASVLSDIYIILGRPTENEITVRVIAPAKAYITYGEKPGESLHKTASKSLSRENLGTFVLQKLNPETRYYYRLHYTLNGEETEKTTEEYSFMTARTSSSPYTFVIQSDSHLLNKANKELYARNMANMAGLNPDFIFDLGDTFLNDKDPDTPFSVINDITFEQVPFFSSISRYASLFLVIGNHEGEYGFYLDGTKDNMSVYAALSRKQYFPNPVPNDFYSGNSTEEEFIGLPENYYSFTWGESLFVALDPYRYTMNDPAKEKDSWAWTLGKKQYDWLKETLEKSKAKYKFVFAHHAIGNIRGGARVAGLYEWGGEDRKGKNLFAKKRPGWEKPVHQLMNDTNVTIFFQGHDHIFSREQVDSVVYQTLPKPAETNPARQSNISYYKGGDNLINSGYLAVGVAEDSVQVDFHRPVVSGQPENKDTGIVYSYTVDNKGKVTVLKTTDDTAAFEAYGGASTKRPKEPKQPKGDNSYGSKITEVALKMSGNLHAQTLIGSPTESSITLSTVFESECQYYYQYGTNPSNLNHKTEIRQSNRESVVKTDILDLKPNTMYYYKMFYKGEDDSDFQNSELNHFVTARQTGDSFLCIIEADPHLDKNSSGQTYETILDLMAEDKPDFIIDLGDTSMAEKLANNVETYENRNELVRSYWDNIGGSVPFFMALGNHDGEHGWPVKGDKPTSREAAEIRRNYFVNPFPKESNFYSGLGDTIYSFEWGDALFIILDPYMYTKKKSATDGWSRTLGKEQYNWLHSVLKNTKAKYRFVFIHNLVGGLGKATRGGAQAAKFFEWGGNNPDGDFKFTSKRPGWAMPIHDLLVEYEVDILFHGHDHFFALEEADGVLYQLVPQPSSAKPQRIKNDLEKYGYQEGVFLPSPGYLRLMVFPDKATVEFIQGAKGVRVHSYSINP
ncbi:3',5'-cyclic adenosine monophosphate phosphodiesterase CpdA [subsurface metagenome]